MKLRITNEPMFHLELSLEEAMVVDEALNTYPELGGDGNYADAISNRKKMSWDIWEPINDAIERAMEETNETK